MLLSLFSTNNDYIVKELCAANLCFCNPRVIAPLKLEIALFPKTARKVSRRQEAVSRGVGSGGEA